jgi:hypothetical protein
MYGVVRKGPKEGLATIHNRVVEQLYQKEDDQEI